MHLTFLMIHECKRSHGHDRDMFIYEDSHTSFSMEVCRTTQTSLRAYRGHGKAFYPVALFKSIRDYTSPGLADLGQGSFRVYPG